MKIIIASYNLGKIRELQELYAPLSIEIESLFDVCRAKIDWQEDGDSFSKNAAIKIDAVRKATSWPILADDSGLIVPSLAGQPGIFSSRYAGANASDFENNELLLKNMRHLHGEQRKAFFICCLCYSKQGANKSYFYGILPGYISHSARGSFGFGYDPIFLPGNSQRSLAELSANEKNAMSHRRRALDKLFLQIANSK